MTIIKNIEAKNPPIVIFSSFEKSLLTKAKKFVEDMYSRQAKNEQITQGGHGIDHTQRVTGMSSFLAYAEKKPPFLPVFAALLHDIGRAVSKDKRSKNHLHGKLSLEIAQEFINAQPISLTDKLLIKNAVEDHPFLNEKVRQSYVVKILMDADRLDALGAMAPVQAASYKWNLPLYKEKPISTEDSQVDSIYGHFGVRIPAWADMMWTKSGKRIAQERLKFLKKFNDEFVKEITFMQKTYDQLGI